MCPCACCCCLNIPSLLPFLTCMLIRYPHVLVDDAKPGHMPRWATMLYVWSTCIEYGHGLLSQATWWHVYRSIHMWLKCEQQFPNTCTINNSTSSEYHVLVLHFPDDLVPYIFKAGYGCYNIHTMIFLALCYFRLLLYLGHLPMCCHRADTMSECLLRVNWKLCSWFVWSCCYCCYYWFQCLRSTFSQFCCHISQSW